MVLMKRSLIVTIKSVVAIMILMFSLSATAFAAPTSSACGKDADDQFLSFPTWYRGLKRTVDTNGNCTINLDGADVGSTVFTITLNIIDIALRIIGIMAVGFVIWGGFQYIISRGEPERTKSGLTTIRNALIGMVISMAAAFVVSFIVARLGS
jgi:hypothetical protein